MPTMGNAGVLCREGGSAASGLTAGAAAFALRLVVATIPLFLPETFAGHHRYLAIHESQIQWVSPAYPHPQLTPRCCATLRRGVAPVVKYDRPPYRRWPVPRGCSTGGKVKLDACARTVLLSYRSIQLLGQYPDNLQAERFCISRSQTAGG